MSFTALPPPALSVEWSGLFLSISIQMAPYSSKCWMHHTSGHQLAIFPLFKCYIYIMLLCLGNYHISFKTQFWSFPRLALGKWNIPITLGPKDPPKQTNKQKTSRRGHVVSCSYVLLLNWTVNPQKNRYYILSIMVFPVQYPVLSEGSCSVPWIIASVTIRQEK